MWPPGPACQPPRSPLPAPSRPAAAQLRAEPPSMCPARGLLLVASLVLLDSLSLARNLPTATPSPGMFWCLDRSQNLLKAVKNSLQKFTQTLKSYPCTPEEIDHEDITKDKSSTVKACLPLELTKNTNCLASGKTSLMMTQCLSSIYEDLKLYQVEFKTLKPELLDQNMLEAIDDLMQALSFSSETVLPKPAIKSDPYKIKMKLCILLHAFKIRAVTIDRMMSYLNSS